METNLSEIEIQNLEGITTRTEPAHNAGGSEETLPVKPSMTFYFNEGGQLEVNGTIISKGTSTEYRSRARMFDTLDVGCGNTPRGTVNVDINFNKHTEHLGFAHISTSGVPNPIIADAYHLPFKDSAFNETYSRALLEHLDIPIQALREMVRVTQNEISLILPHRWFRGGLFKGQPKEHKHMFTKHNLSILFKKLNLNYEFTRIEFRGYPSAYLSIIRLPHLIYTKIRLNK